MSGCSSSRTDVRTPNGAVCGQSEPYEQNTAARVRELGTTDISAHRDVCHVEFTAGPHMSDTLYAVQNLFNKVTVIELDSTYRSGVLAKTISDPTLDTPATIAASGQTSTR